MGEVPVRLGAGEAFAALARDLRRAAAGGLRKELYAGLQRAAKPTLAAVRANAGVLPSGGGRGRRRTRLVDTGTTLTNAASGRTHKVKRRVKVGGDLATGESVADRVAGASFTVRALAGRAGDARIRLQATERRGKKVDLRALNDGRLRHPLFGNRRHWYQQAVPPGWFDKPIQDNAATFERELGKAVDKVAREIEGS